jgi:hypothetical protein
MLKKIVIGLGIVAALIAGLLIFVFGKTAGMPDEADLFFEKLKKGDFSAAHSMTAVAFQKATTVDQLAQFSEMFTLDKLSNTSYSARGFENEMGYLEGDLKYTDGSLQPMRIEFVKEDGDWKVLHVTPKSGAGVTSASSAATPAEPIQHQIAPGEDEAKALVNESIIMLADAIIKRDFADFYSYSSNMWQAQTTKEALLTAFKEFIDKKIDLIHTQNTKLIIQPPQVDLQNALNIDAEWDTKPVRTVGNFRYVKEGGKWKLIGVAVNLKE